MPTTLPVPVEFRLPEGWSPADPDMADVYGVAFAALYEEPDDGFTANITIDGELRIDLTPLDEIADESVERMREAAESVNVLDRKEAGSSGAPALTQTMGLSADVEGVRRELVQLQVYLALLDVNDSRKRAVLRLALTSTVAQVDTLLGDFQAFVSTIRPDTGPASKTSAMAGDCPLGRRALPQQGRHPRVKPS